MSDAATVTLAGVSFEISPASALMPLEQATLQRIGQHDGGGDEPYRIELASIAAAGRDAAADEEPARITIAGDVVRLDHARFRGDLDVGRRAGRLDRGVADDGSAIEIFLRMALGCALPARGGVLLHATGVVIDGEAILFCGRSGAGKTTLASLVTAPVLSDEVIAVREVDGRFIASASGFWGSLDAPEAPHGAYPLRAIADLARGDGIEIDRLARGEAVRRLLLTTVVPPHAGLWRLALPVVTAIVERVPAFQLAWSASAENAARIFSGLLK